MIMNIKAGFADRDITPKYPVNLGGYGARDRKSDGIKESISVGCAAVAGETGTILLITVDSIGIHIDDVNNIKNAIQKKVGIDPEHIVIAASHTHFAPFIGIHKFNVPGSEFIFGDEKFKNQMETRILECVEQSMMEMEDAELQYYRIPVSQVLYNRRARKADGSVETVFLYPREREDYLFSPVDDDLTVIRFKGPVGILGVVVNFSCHPVTGGVNQEEHYKISSDYPYYVREAISSAWNCPVLFTLGAAGDAVPMNRQGNCRKLIGESIGNAAILGERRFVTDPNPEVKASISYLEASVLEHPGVDSPVDVPGLRAAYVNSPEDSEEKREAWRAYQTALDRKFRSILYHTEKAALPIQFFRLGPFQFACIPFEVLSEIALKVKEKVKTAGIISCANGYQGYLPLKHEFPRGGYEAQKQSVHFEAGTADRILDLIVDTLTHGQNE
jgi:neutral ceramidase